MFRSMQLFLVFFIIISHGINGQQDPETLWNMREKDRLIKHIRRSEEYRGFFYDNHEWILHELVPQEKNKYHYRKISSPFMESTDCIFTGTDPNKIVQDIMKSYTGEAEECNEPDKAELHEKLTEQESYIEPMKFRLLGSMDNRWVGLVSYRKLEEDTDLPGNFFRMHYVDKNGIQEKVEETIYYDSLRPIAVSGRYKLIMDLPQRTIKIYRKNKTIKLPDHVNRYLLEWAKRSNFLKGNPAPFILHDSYLYGFILPNKNDDPFQLYRISLENGTYEKLYDNSVSPRIVGNQLYFFRMMPQQGNPAEIDLDEYGLLKVDLKNNKLHSVINVGIIKYIDFQAMLYVPEMSGSQVIYQKLEELGDESETRIIDLEMIREINLSALQEAENTLQEIRKTYKEQMQQSTFDFKFVKFPFIPSSADSLYIREEMNYLKEEFSEADDGKKFAAGRTDADSYLVQFRREELPDELQEQSADLKTGEVLGPFVKNNGYIIYRITEVSGDKYEIASIYREIYPGNEVVESVYNRAEQFAEKADDLDSFIAIAENNNLEIFEATDVSQDSEAINKLDDPYEISRWLSGEASIGEVSEIMNSGNYLILAILTGSSGNDSLMKDLSEKRDMVKRQLEKKYNEVESTLNKSLSRVLVPGNYVLVPDPVSGKPVFVSGNPFWPILGMEDVLELE